MSNHSDFPGNSPIPDAIREILKIDLIGATGQHPHGRLTSTDEGSIQFAISVKDGKVCMDFGTPVVWLGMGPEDAVQLAQRLIKHARNVAKETGKVLTVSI